MHSHSSTRLYRIGEAAQHSGVSVASIRHYERVKLLPAARREGNGYRRYSEQDVHLLRLIRMCRLLDMPVNEVRLLIQLDETQAQDCAQAARPAASHLGHVQARIAELQQLQRLMAACNSTGPGCRVFATMHRQPDAETIPADGACTARPQHI